MDKKILIEHLVEYLLLLVVLTIGYLILKFVPGITWKIILSFTLASFYLGYGSYHHFNEKELKLSIVLEYTAVALIILVSLLLILG